MKLNLKDIQCIDILLKDLTYDLKPSSHFYLVIKIDNQLWRGDFAIFENHNIKEYYTDYSGDIESFSKTKSSFFKINSEFRPSRFLKLFNNSNDKTNLNHLILKEIIKTINESTSIDFVHPHILYNAVNLNSNIELPFLCLNEDEYEIISLIEIKDECTHC